MQESPYRGIQVPQLQVQQLQVPQQVQTQVLQHCGIHWASYPVGAGARLEHVGVTGVRSQG